MKFFFIVLTSILFFVTAAGENREHDFIKGKIAEIEVSSDDRVIYKTVDVSIGEVLVLEFPEDVSLEEKPVLGDAALLKVEIETSPLRVKVWGLLFADLPETRMYGLNTNLQISLNTGTSLIINFRIAPSSEATSRIIFTFPYFTKQRREVQEMLISMRNKLEKNYRKKMDELESLAQKRKKEMITRSFSEFFYCNTYRSRSQNKLVFLMSDRICKIGGEKEEGGEVYINFIVKNRYRNYFYIGDVRVYALKNSGKIPLEHEVFLEKYGIKFDEVLNGAVGFSLDKDDYAPEYIIEIVEEAGKQRKISLKVGF